ncbi:hypothetical protein N8T08_005522 [Aspergillus melleus]|uniref:Uncharacterized protein n=1 Tax=Aspergillus melleus TaxID=138277 RepID=A0ACC3B2F1_9EURO|nr:hypothetical protein N8T08_005522 [Aspergillus melleus]
MAPQILHRVIHGNPSPEPWQKALLTFKPAVLHGYRRHRVRGADYPGIIKVPGSSEGSSLDETSNSTTGTASASGSGSGSGLGPQTEGAQTIPEGSVLGTVVSGLTDGDIHRLNIFEGPDYVKEPVTVRILQETLSMDGSSHDGLAHAHDDSDGGKHLRDVLDAAGAEFADEGEEVRADTYVWVGGEGKLEEAEWDFEAFKRDKMAWWVGADESEW